MLVDFGRASWFERARQQPERVRQALDKMRTDGVAQTIDAIRSKLDQPLPLGYCNVGLIEEVGPEVTAFAPGDRIVSNGPHAELVAVPHTLCARIPERVSDDHAAFAVLGAIALQGIRLATPTLGERFVVTGLGVIGLLAVQILRAHGCHVLGIDPDPYKTQLARQFGAHTVELDRGEDPLAVAAAFSDGLGIDGVLITASTKSSEPVSHAAKMCRKRGRIVLVGVAGLELDRSDFYQKELSFQVSCSYGPGRYDPEYEEKGHDYPLGYVRWTEQRNFEAVLGLMAEGSLNVEPLLTHRFTLDDASAAYDLLASGAERHLGILLQYSGVEQVRVQRIELPRRSHIPEPRPAARVGFIGAGNYAGRILMPAFAKAGATMSSIASGGGVTAAHYGRKHGFQAATTEAASVIADPTTEVVVVATRHDSHARYVVDALRARKHVFVEKPLSIDMQGIDEIEKTLASGEVPQPILMVGFNRRFAPHIVRIKSLLGALREPRSFIVTVNAGSIPALHWTQDRSVGGGRIIGEACHFIDLLRFLAGCSIERAAIEPLGKGATKQEDSSSITLRFEDGSVGTILYLANGHRRVAKERLEVFCAGRILQLDNFMRLSALGWSGRAGMSSWRQNKGQTECVAAFLEAVRFGRPSPIPLEEVLEVARVTVSLAEAARS
jgi:predicted dehydrogenase/threonine dehydrogenase-like Zn-dependent dehydrogenase